MKWQNISRRFCAHRLVLGIVQVLFKGKNLHFSQSTLWRKMKEVHKSTPIPLLTTARRCAVNFTSKSLYPQQGTPGPCNWTAPIEATISHSPTAPRQAVDPPSLLPSGIVWFSPKGKANGHEVEFSSSSNYKVKNTWSFANNSSSFSIVLCLIRPDRILTLL